MDSAEEYGCMKFFTCLARCQSPYTQFYFYYQHGTLTTCMVEKRKLKNCLQSKTSNRSLLKQLEEEREENASHNVYMPDLWSN